MDGANEFQIASKVYTPISKATIATVALFYGISRWNGYFWVAQTITAEEQIPLQVYIRNFLDNYVKSVDSTFDKEVFSVHSLFYCMIVASVIPIIIIYPFIQKYFAAGFEQGNLRPEHGIQRTVFYGRCWNCRKQ